MDFLKFAKRLPVIDWNLTFFGAHEQKVARNWRVPVEKHYAFECIFVLEGTEFISIQGQNYTVEEGDFALIPPEFSHQVWAGKNLKYFCFHFDIDDPGLKTRLVKGIEYYYSKNSRLGKKIRSSLLKLDSLVANSEFDFNTKMIIQIELSKILQFLYQETIEARISSVGNQVNYSRMMADFMKDHLTNQVLAYVKNGYIPHDKNVEVEDAIKAVGLSSGYGFRIFKKAYGISPRDYLTRLKINEAKKLLLKRYYSVGEIGLALGYSGIGNFSRQFKRWTGQSPNEFRRQQQ